MESKDTEVIWECSMLLIDSDSDTWHNRLSHVDSNKLLIVYVVIYRPKDHVTYQNQITPVLINFKLITQSKPKKNEQSVKVFAMLEANFDCWTEGYSLL